MSMLRIVAIAFGSVGLFSLWMMRYRRRRLRNLDRLVGVALSIGAISLGIFPDALNGLLSLFSFEQGGGRRLIGLLIFSNSLLYALFYVVLLRSTRTEQLIDRLVRELAKKQFRRDFEPEHAPIQVIIPAYNESENIAQVLERIPEEVCGLRTRPLVVVDGATDDTEEVVRRLEKAAISKVLNRGGGSALKAGYEIAIEQGAEIIVTLDADGQHQPEEMERLIQPILDDEADLVNGSRVLGTYDKDNQVRAAGVVFFNALVSLLTFQKITDCSNSFRAIRASKLSMLDLQQSQFHSSELLIDAIKKGLRVKEVPITITRRLSGETKKPRSLLYGWGFAKAIFSTWLR